MVAPAAGFELLGALEALVGAVEARPLDHVRWLPHQVRLFRSGRRRRLLRTGNQLGKTWAGLAEVIWAAEGTHPYRTPTRSAGEYWIVCATWAQSLAIQKKLWRLLAPGSVHPATEFDDVNGFRGKHPSVRVRHADGSWSLIRIKTTHQGTLSLSGATIDGVLFDEPPVSQGIYDEIAKRVQAQGGWVLLTLTPIGAPVDWLRELTLLGQVEDIHSDLTPEALVPEGSVRPIRIRTRTGLLIPADAAFVEHVIATTSPNVVPVRVHGAWESRVLDAYFAGAFERLRHVTDEVPDGEVELWLGVDHGHRPGKQIALLVCVQGTLREPFVYVLDEYVDVDGTHTPWEDAAEILAMLEGYGWGWDDLDGAGGDRVHMKGTAQQKSNRDLMAALATQLDLDPSELRPRIRTVKRGESRGSGSVRVGARWLFHRFVEGRILIHPRCERLILALQRWRGPGVAVRRGSEEEGYADPVDALRYALDRFIFGRVREQGRAQVALG